MVQSLRAKLVRPEAPLPLVQVVWEAPRPREMTAELAEVGVEPDLLDRVTSIAYYLDLADHLEQQYLE